MKIHRPTNVQFHECDNSINLRITEVFQNKIIVETSIQHRESKHFQKTEYCTRDTHSVVLHSSASKRDQDYLKINTEKKKTKQGQRTTQKKYTPT